MTVDRLTLCQPITSRSASTSKDGRGVNCYFETSGDHRSFVKRPGYSTVAVSPSLSAGTAQGMYPWNSALYTVVGTTLSKITSGLVSSTIGTISNNGRVWFVESANNTNLFLHNSSDGYVLSSGGTLTRIDPTGVYSVNIITGGSGYVSPSCIFSPPVSGVTATGTVQSVGGVITGVTITNPGSGYTSAPTCTITGAPGVGVTTSVTLSGFPATPLASGCCYLDGYTVIATQSGQILTSDLEAPSMWNPLNFLTAQAEPDGLKAICKHFNYIVAFGEWSTEYFYNAGASPGSPLARQDSLRNEIGIADGNSMVQLEQIITYVGKTKLHGKSVYVLDGTNPVKISNRYIERYLNADTNTNILAFGYKIEGHSFYIMSLPNLDITLVYDFDEKEWYQWSSFYSAAEHYFVPQFISEFNNAWYALDKSSGSIYSLSTSVYQDSGAAIYTRSVTGNIDSGTKHRKLFYRLEIVGDVLATSNTMSINYSDDDFNTFSTSRTVDLSLTRPILYQLGQSRRRAWQFLYIGNTSMKINACEFDIQFCEREEGQ